MTLNGVMAVTLRYFSEVGKPALQETICGGIYARVYCFFLVRVQCRRKESSRSLSHLLMSFLCIMLSNCKVKTLLSMLCYFILILYCDIVVRFVSCWQMVVMVCRSIKT